MGADFHRASELAPTHLDVARPRLLAVSPESCRASFHQHPAARGECDSAVLVIDVGYEPPGPSLFIAALFALHPINVESVAWVAERKNVLCTMFFFLTLWAYGWYARKPHWARYLAVAGLFAAGLASKPMVITLPFVLLLLDYWPLARI